MFDVSICSCFAFQEFNRHICSWYTAYSNDAAACEPVAKADKAEATAKPKRKAYRPEDLSGVVYADLDYFSVRGSYSRPSPCHDNKLYTLYIYINK